MTQPRVRTHTHTCERALANWWARRIGGKVHGQANGWTDERTDGPTNGRGIWQADGWTDGRGHTWRRTDGQIDERVDDRTGGRADGQTAGREDGRTDERTGGRTGGRKDVTGRAGGLHRTDGRRHGAQ